MARSNSNSLLKAAVALLVLCCASARGVWGAVRPYPFAIDEADDDRPMTFDEQAILFELTAHADALERGEEAHALSAHTKAWMEAQMWADLREMAEREQFTRQKSSQEISFGDALRFKQRYMAKRGKRWSPGKWLKNKAKAALGAVVDGAKAVGGAVKAGARWVKNKAKAIWNKYKCPICKFAVEKLSGFIKDKGIDGACKWAAKGICALASVPICGPVAPVCRTVLCPLVNPLLKSGCSKIVNWLVSKLEDKLDFSPEGVCSAIKLCKGTPVNLSKGAKGGKDKGKEEKDDKKKGKDGKEKEAKETGKGEEKKAKDKSASGGESGGESGGKHKKKKHHRRHHKKGHRTRRHHKKHSGSGGASGGASGGESGGKSKSVSGGAEKKEEKSGDSGSSSSSSGSGGGEKKETITMAKHNEQIQSMQQQIDELKAKLAAQGGSGKPEESKEKSEEKKKESFFL